MDIREKGRERKERERYLCPSHMGRNVHQFLGIYQAFSKKKKKKKYVDMFLSGQQKVGKQTHTKNRVKIKIQKFEIMFKQRLEGKKKEKKRNRERNNNNSLVE